MQPAIRAHGRCMNQLKELVRSAEVQAKFLHDNARRVFKL
ncbi:MULTISPECIES: amidohydrolase [Pseudomonas]|nr:amidohydrolase [Pseudomonas tumuqii]